jgi:hypothetical protein
MPENSRRHDQYSESHTPSTTRYRESRIWEIGEIHNKHRKQTREDLSGIVRGETKLD